MAEGEFSSAKTSVWWDIENCAVPKGFDAHNIAKNISAALANKGYRGETSITAYGDTSKINTSVQHALNSAGVNFNHVPAGVKDGADKKMLVDMCMWPISNPPPANYLLISGDRDFSNALHKLRLKGYNILLAHPPNVSQALVAAANCVWLWSSLVAGGTSWNADSSLKSSGTDTDSGNSSEGIEETKNAHGNGNPTKTPKKSKRPTPGMQDKRNGSPENNNVNANQKQQTDQLSAPDQVSEAHDNAQSKNNTVAAPKIRSATFVEPDKETRSLKSLPHNFYATNSTVCTGPMTSTSSSTSSEFPSNSGNNQARPGPALRPNEKNLAQPPFAPPGKLHASSSQGNNFFSQPRGTSRPSFENPPQSPQAETPPDISRLHRSEHPFRVQQPISHHHNPEMRPRFSGKPQNSNPAQNFGHFPPGQPEYLVPPANNGNTYGTGFSGGQAFPTKAPKKSKRPTPGMQDKRNGSPENNNVKANQKQQTDQLSAPDLVSEAHDNAQSKNNTGTVAAPKIRSATFVEPDKETRSLKSLPHNFYATNSAVCTEPMTSTSSSTSSEFPSNSGNNQARPGPALRPNEKNLARPPFEPPGNLHASSSQGNNCFSQQRGTSRSSFENPSQSPQAERSPFRSPSATPPDISRLHRSEHPFRVQQPISHQHNPEMRPRFSGKPQNINPAQNFGHFPPGQPEYLVPPANNGNTYGTGFSGGQAFPTKAPKKSKRPTPGMQDKRNGSPENNNVNANQKQQTDQLSAPDQVSEAHDNAQSKNNTGTVAAPKIRSATFAEPDKETRSLESLPHNFYATNSTVCTGPITSTSSSTSSEFPSNSGNNQARPGPALRPNEKNLARPPFAPPGNLHASSSQGNNFFSQQRGTSRPSFENPSQSPQAERPSFRSPSATVRPPDISRLHRSEHPFRVQQPISHQHNPEMRPRFSGKPQNSNPAQNFGHFPPGQPEYLVPPANNGNTYGTVAAPSVRSATFAEPDKETRSLKSFTHNFYATNSTVCTGPMTSTSSSTSSEFPSNSGINQVRLGPELRPNEKNPAQPPFIPPGNSFFPQPRGTSTPSFENPPQSPQALPDISRLNMSEHPIGVQQRPIPHQHHPEMMARFSDTPPNSNPAQNFGHFPSGRPEYLVPPANNGTGFSGGQVFLGPTPELHFHIDIILHVLDILRKDKMAPTETNIGDCILFGERKHPDFNVKLGLDYGMRYGMIVKQCLGDSLRLYIRKNDRLWNCVNIMDANARHPKETWDTVQKYMSSPIGRAMLLDTKCMYEAAMVLKTYCLKDLPLGTVLQILQLTIVAKKWVVPHSSGW